MPVRVHSPIEEHDLCVLPPIVSSFRNALAFDSFLTYDVRRNTLSTSELTFMACPVPELKSDQLG